MSNCWRSWRQSSLRALIMVGLLSLAALAQSDTIIAGADEWCPMNCEPDSPHSGFMVEIATRIFAQEGHEFKYIKIPWKRTLEEVRQGKIQAAIGAFKGDAPDFVFPEEPQARLSGNGLFVLKSSNWQYTGIKSLRSVRMGAILSYDYGEALNHYIRNHSYSGRIELLAGTEPLRRNIEKSRIGRIDVVVEAGPVFWYTAKQMGVADQFKQVGQVTEAEDCFIAFSPALPKSKHYARILGEGIRKMRRSGELAVALQKYGLKDWK